MVLTDNKSTSANKGRRRLDCSPLEELRSYCIAVNSQIARTLMVRETWGLPWPSTWTRRLLMWHLLVRGTRGAWSWRRGLQAWKPASESEELEEEDYPDDEAAKGGRRARGQGGDNMCLPLASGSQMTPQTGVGLA